MKKPYQIESHQAVKRLARMAAEGFQPCRSFLSEFVRKEVKYIVSFAKGVSLHGHADCATYDCYKVK